MKTLNARSLNVKTLVKDTLSKTAKYKKMYSNVLKDGDLRLKYYDLVADNISSVVSDLKSLDIGLVEKVATGKFGLVKKPIWSIIVHVNSDKVN